MTRIAKLYAAVLANPKTAITFAEFERLLRATGFVLVRIKGSHRHYDVPQVFTVLPDGKAVKVYLVRRFLEIVDEHGLHVEI
ncbi:type II toxin-antitoxin system HicA family toxin [Sphingomonas oligophenolica]|uniref:Type II toxin-antitoxin system HicA family toxin n=1 Tax=Sphingomonas oligophenolica TaxID=301154 RepID=A0A502CHQ3_9SPHN|nr:type II toxin-antitoxin system HicA family toxin [Sphingomonas oligophenolica]TPG12134.1 type II toxin-antitoxin system HicA family toxin [Sphingomonas oligophenolica]